VPQVAARLLPPPSLLQLPLPLPLPLSTRCPTPTPGSRCSCRNFGAFSRKRTRGAAAARQVARVTPPQPPSPPRVTLKATARRRRTKMTTLGSPCSLISRRPPSLSTLCRSARCRLLILRFGSERRTSSLSPVLAIGTKLTPPIHPQLLLAPAPSALLAVSETDRTEAQGRRVVASR
jgi:hypothetical protein